MVREPGGRTARHAAPLRAQCGTSIIVVAELRFGILKRGSERLRSAVDLILEALPVVSWDSPADEHYAALRVQLERSGMPISANDMLIAAHALALDATLVTANEREFRRVPNLRVENWAN